MGLVKIIDFAHLGFMYDSRDRFPSGLVGENIRRDIPQDDSPTLMAVKDGILILASTTPGPVCIHSREELLKVRKLCDCALAERE